jgi:hypothetical protein
MDSPLTIGPSLLPRLAHTFATRGPESAPYAAATSAAEPNPTSALKSLRGSDPATQQRLMLHFISHIDAECFISLLQTVDPKPDDYRARAEYNRFYHQLRESLEVPLAPQDPLPAGPPAE